MTPRLTHACVITDDVHVLTSFYELLLGTKPTRSHDDYVEFATPSGAALSLYARTRLEPYAPGAARPGSNRAVMLEFEVADVDAEYARLRESVHARVARGDERGLDLPDLSSRA